MEMKYLFVESNSRVDLLRFLLISLLSFFLPAPLTRCYIKKACLLSIVSNFSISRRSLGARLITHFEIPDLREITPIVITRACTEIGFNDREKNLNLSTAVLATLYVVSECELKIATTKVCVDE